MWSRLFAYVLCKCMCVCMSFGWCWVKTCVTKRQSLRINMMTGCIAENFSDYWSILAIRHVIFKPLHSFCHILFTYFMKFFGDFYYQFHCVTTVRDHILDKDLPILYIGDKSVSTGSLFSIPVLFKRGDFWHKMIDTSAKCSSINSMHSKNAVENLLYTHTLSRVISTTNRVWK